MSFCPESWDLINSILNAADRIRKNIEDRPEKEMSIAKGEMLDALKRCDDAMWEIVDALEEGIYSE